MDNPEQQARKEIDRLQTAAGWHICDANAADIHAPRGITIRHFEEAAGFLYHLTAADEVSWRLTHKRAIQKRVGV